MALASSSEDAKALLASVRMGVVRIGMYFYSTSSPYVIELSIRMLILSERDTAKKEFPRVFLRRSLLIHDR
jgi:hypothetical protein